MISRNSNSILWSLNYVQSHPKTAPKFGFIAIVKAKVKKWRENCNLAEKVKVVATFVFKEL